MSTQASGPPALRVYTLGSLRLVREADAISDSAWVRKKSRTLFGHLLCARPRGVHKEQLMELLWPWKDPVRSAHTLQVVLSDLRVVLGGGSRLDGRAFVCRTGDSYSLDVGQAGWVDVEAFEAACEAGRRAESAGDVEAAVRHFAAAESLYGGDFLMEEQFSDWAAARRERVRDQYVDVMVKLLRHHEAGGRVRIAAEYAKKVLAADPYLEPCYRDLMRYCAGLGDRSGVLRAYTRCEKAIREGFDSEVSAETRALASTLLGFPVTPPPARGERERRRIPGGADLPPVRERPAVKRLGIP